MIFYLRAANLLDMAAQWSKIQLLCFVAVAPLLSYRTEPASLEMATERVQDMELYGQEAFHIVLCVVLYYFLDVLEWDREDLARLRKALAEHDWLLDRSRANWASKLKTQPNNYMETKTKKVVLSLDFGGTEFRAGVFTRAEEHGRPIAEASTDWKSHEVAGNFVAAIREFLGRNSTLSVEAICFGVAGAVRNGYCRFTNLACEVDQDALEAVFGVPVEVANDAEMVAAAVGAGAIDPEHYVVLHPGAPDAVGNYAVFTLGTGVGASATYRDPVTGLHHAYATEYGHIQFAPTSAQEVLLLEHLWHSGLRQTITSEKLLRGQGIVAIYKFLVDDAIISFRDFKETDLLPTDLPPHELAVAITKAAKTYNPLCWEAYQLYATILGTAAQSLALGAPGGVFIGGGVASKIVDLLTGNNAFSMAFENHSVHAKLLKQVPVSIIMEPYAGLLGAAERAWQLLARRGH